MESCARWLGGKCRTVAVVKCSFTVSGRAGREPAPRSRRAVIGNCPVSMINNGSMALCFLLLTGCAKHFPVRGMILGIDPSQQSVVVSHRDIPHYMPAMSMQFRVRTVAELNGLAPGAQIECVLVVRKSGAYIEQLRRIGASAVIA